MNKEKGDSMGYRECDVVECIEKNGECTWGLKEAWLRIEDIDDSEKQRFFNSPKSFEFRIKEESEADQVREILKTGWCKIKDSDEYISVAAIRGDEITLDTHTSGYIRSNAEHIIKHYESVTYAEVLEIIK